MDRRQPQDIRVALYNNAIGPGAARVVHYRVKVPPSARGTITLSAGTHYRKFSRDYTTFSLGADHPSLPVTTLASDRVTLPLKDSPLPAGAVHQRQAPGSRQHRPEAGGIGTGVRGNPIPSGCAGTTTASASSSRGTSRARPPRGRRSPSSLPTSRTGPSTARGRRSPRAASATRRRRWRRPSGGGRAGARRRSSARRSPRTRAASTMRSGTCGRSSKSSRWTGRPGTRSASPTGSRAGSRTPSKPTDGRSRSTPRT